MISNYQQLISNLSYLKLEEMNNHLDETIDYINRNDVSFVDGLIKLTNYQIALKEKNMVNAMIKVANFPFLKEMKDFDFNYQENINKKEIMDFLDVKCKIKFTKSCRQKLPLFAYQNAIYI